MRKLIILFVLLFSTPVFADIVVDPGHNVLSQAASTVPNGEVIILAAGLYTQTQSVNILGKSLSVIGKGPEVTEIRFTNSNGFVVDTNSTTKHVTLQGFTLSTTNSGGYEALRMRAARTTSNSNKQFLVDNLNIRPHDMGSDYWSYGMKVINGWITNISNVHVRGKDNSTKMTTGIDLSGCSIEVKISKCAIYFAGTGVSVKDDAEGIYIDGTTIVYATNGIMWVSPAAESLLNVTGCHISTFSTSIYTYNVHWSQIVGNMLMKRHDSNKGYVGIFIINGNLNTIIGNTILGAGIGGGQNGIVLDNVDYSIVVGNVLRDQHTDIWVRGGSYRNNVGGNTGNGIYYHIFDQGVGTKIF